MGKLSRHAAGGWDQPDVFETGAAPGEGDGGAVGREAWQEDLSRLVGETRCWAAGTRDGPEVALRDEGDLVVAGTWKTKQGRSCIASLDRRVRRNSRYKGECNYNLT